jgi:hypothetical protein
MANHGSQQHSFPEEQNSTCEYLQYRMNRAARGLLTPCWDKLRHLRFEIEGSQKTRVGNNSTQADKHAVSPLRHVKNRGFMACHLGVDVHAQKALRVTKLGLEASFDS